MQKGLVSILTPCYNTGKYIHRLLDSILYQTYPYIEMFVIDDGSTDDSKAIIYSYIPKFKKKGYSLTYIYQSNSGQSAAIDRGLKLINGEYLVWPDSDDFYASELSIQKMVEKLNSSPSEFAMVRTMERLVDENNIAKTLGINGEYAKEEESLSLFYDCLFNVNNFYFVPGAYMVRIEALKKVNGLSIYVSKNAGQNWQLMLPVLYTYRCLTIKEILYTVLVRNNSHSRGQYVGYDQTIAKFDAYCRTICETLNRIKPLSDERRIYLKNYVNTLYLRRFLSVDIRYKKLEIIKQRYKEIISIDGSQLLIGDYIVLFCVKTGLIKLNLFNKILLHLLPKMSFQKVYDTDNR